MYGTIPAAADRADRTDLAPSTLRWWESQQVLPKPPRVNGRRVYTETELRRIGLAYLCCVTGSMPLVQAAVVTSGKYRNQQWRSTVQQHADLLEEQIRMLQNTHGYLLHLLRCPDDDIISECPDLDQELADHTPCGRVLTHSLVDAAQSIQRGRTPREKRDEKRAPRDETVSVLSRCAVCATPITQPTQGRHRKYCSRACQQRRHRQNKRQRKA
ncbi:MerR family transcriptional regulator [Spongiactinospora gelatinilytica]|uniref:MerR family transcriptional regulator n=1 Tax=Spongiactinospora gelatinilytica TaxID=2666298 RepID=A0A2W2I125_9ACTN|nr:MerR family transcriptional regulator [Spongiactinospora gelatinilytica]